MAKREYPLEITYSMYLDRGTLANYYSKGHHDKAVFLEELKAEEFPESYVDGPITLEYVQHKYCRNSVEGGLEPGWFVYRYYDEPGRGRYPVTVYDIEQQRLDEAAQRRDKEASDGRV